MKEALADGVELAVSVRQRDWATAQAEKTA